MVDALERYHGSVFEIADLVSGAFDVAKLSGQPVPIVPRCVVSSPVTEHSLLQVELVDRYGMEYLALAVSAGTVSAMVGTIDGVDLIADFPVGHSYPTFSWLAQPG